MRILESSDVVSAFFEVEAVEASRHLHTPVVYYYAGPIDPRRLARGRFARIVAISQMVADYHADLAPRYGLQEIDGIVLPGIPDEKIVDGPAPHVADAHPEVLFTGRLDATPQKRAEKLIEWWPAIIEAVPGAHLRLVGGGTDLPHLRQKVAAMGLAGSIALPGPVPHNRMFECLRTAGLYVFPSSLETFGIAALEALAAGLPVVASDLPALRESLGDAAIFVPVEDDAAWIETLVRLLSDAPARLELAGRGPEWARQFTWVKQSRLYEAQLVAAAASRSISSESEVTARRNATRV